MGSCAHLGLMGSCSFVFFFNNYDTLLLINVSKRNYSQWEGCSVHINNVSSDKTIFVFVDYNIMGDNIVTYHSL